MIDAEAVRARACVWNRNGRMALFRREASLHCSVRSASVSSNVSRAALRREIAVRRSERKKRRGEERRGGV